MAVRLSARLMALADFVSPGARLADVGTDHGYIPVFLCQTGKIKNAIAMDINRGPLRRAEAHVAEYGLQKNIQLRLSDGLHALAPEEADTILIAGMGGALVKRILDEGVDVLRTSPELILQPQSEIPSVRMFLREIGYTVVDEDCVLEDGKFYFMMKAHRLKGDTDAEFGHIILEDTFGPVLLKKRHPVLRRFLERELAINEEICEKLTEQMNVLESSGAMSSKQKIVTKQGLQSNSHLNSVDAEDTEADWIADSGASVEKQHDDRKRKLIKRRQEIRGKQVLLQWALAFYT